MPTPPENADIWDFDENSTRYELCYTPESIRHPAKMHLPMCREIIKRYTKQGDLILDCMAGIGTTVIEGMLLGRNVIGVEYEQKFVDMAQANIDKTKKQMGFMKGLGEGKIVKGDSRELVKVLDGVWAENNIFSPPFADRVASQDKKYLREVVGIKGGQAIDQEYSDNKEDKNNIANLKYEPVDSIITSPPYAHGSYQDIHTMHNPSLFVKRMKGEKGGQFVSTNYSDDQNNCGNLSGSTYLSEMLKIYQQCYAVLKNDGSMILVTKNFTRSGKEVRLDTDTIKLCEMAGFEYVTRHYRKIKNQSFWIRNAIIKWKKKHPDIPPPYPMFEDVLVFKKRQGR